MCPRTWRAVTRSGGSCAQSGVPTVEFRASDHHRLGKRLLRDRALARRPLARPARSTLGRPSRAADRDRGRPRLPARRSRPRARREPALRDRRRRPRHVRRPHAGVRAPARPPARRDSRSPRDAAPLSPLAEPRDAGVRGIGRELVESLRNDTIVDDGSAREAFPIRPRGFREAIERALANEDREFAETRWSDALSAYHGRNWGGVTLGQRAVASRMLDVAASPEQTFAQLQRIGGKTGWYYANGFWRLRGLLDKIVGGVGLRRGRRDPVGLAVGDTLDFWRVEAFEQDHLLRLRAEMKVPGRHLAAVRGRRRSRRRDAPPDRDLRPRRPRRARVLEGALPDSPRHLRGHAATIGQAAVASRDPRSRDGGMAPSVASTRGEPARRSAAARSA